MKFICGVAIFLLGCFLSHSQSKKIEKLKETTVAEGKLLYQSEMASWFGTDTFIEKFKERSADIGGYFSYPDGNQMKCVFFSKVAKVIGTISFDGKYSVEDAIIDGTIRDFSSTEKEYYEMRTAALDEIRANKDKLYSFYEDTSLNLIPLIKENEKKVYVLTGPQKNGIVLFGNDYLLTFDKNNKIVTQKKLHKSLLTMEYKNSVSAMHSHLKDIGEELITATDICTLMLYQKYTNWESYIVLSKDYVSIWNCKSESLIVMTKKAWETMNDNIKENSKKD